MNQNSRYSRGIGGSRSNNNQSEIGLGYGDGAYTNSQEYRSRR